MPAEAAPFFNRTVMLNSKSLVSALIATACLHWTAIDAFAQAVRVPGTKVSLEPPAGFSPAQQYPGFEREADRASIMVTELPGPAAEMIRGMTREALASRGMVLMAASRHVINKNPARLLSVRQRTANGEVLKSMLIAGDRATTIMIVGMFPADSPYATGAAIERALMSASWGAGSPNAFEGLPFRITPTSRLKLAKRVSNMLMFTESGTIGSPGSSEALYLVGHSIGRGDIADLRSFSESRARQTTLMKGLENFTGRTIQIDGLDGYEIEADAVDARSGAPMRLYQVIMLDETGYFIAQGLARADRAAVLLPEFRTVTQGFSRNVR